MERMGVRVKVRARERQREGRGRGEGESREDQGEDEGEGESAHMTEGDREYIRPGGRNRMGGGEIARAHH